MPGYSGPTFWPRDELEKDWDDPTQGISTPATTFQQDQRQRQNDVAGIFNEFAPPSQGIDWDVPVEPEPVVQGPPTLPAGPGSGEQESFFGLDLTSPSAFLRQQGEQIGRFGRRVMEEPLERTAAPFRGVGAAVRGGVSGLARTGREAIDAGRALISPTSTGAERGMGAMGLVAAPFSVPGNIAAEGQRAAGTSPEAAELIGAGVGFATPFGGLGSIRGAAAGSRARSLITGAGAAGAAAGAGVGAYQAREEGLSPLDAAARVGTRAIQGADIATGLGELGVLGARGFRAVRERRGQELGAIAGVGRTNVAPTDEMGMVRGRLAERPEVGAEARIGLPQETELFRGDIEDTVMRNEDWTPAGIAQIRGGIDFSTSKMYRRGTKGTLRAGMNEFVADHLPDARRLPAIASKLGGRERRAPDLMTFMRGMVEDYMPYKDFYPEFGRWFRQITTDENGRFDQGLFNELNAVWAATAAQTAPDSNLAKALSAMKAVRAFQENLQRLPTGAELKHAMDTGEVMDGLEFDFASARARLDRQARDAAREAGDPDWQKARHKGGVTPDIVEREGGAVVRATNPDIAVPRGFLPVITSVDAEKVMRVYNDGRLEIPSNFKLSAFRLITDVGGTNTYSPYSVIDTHMFRLFGFDENEAGKSPQASRFVQAVVKRLADEMGLEPHQVQSALWFGAKNEISSMSPREIRTTRPWRIGTTQADVGTRADDGTLFYVAERNAPSLDFLEGIKRQAAAEGRSGAATPAAERATVVYPEEGSGFRERGRVTPKFGMDDEFQARANIFAENRGANMSFPAGEDDLRSWGWSPENPRIDWLDDQNIPHTAVLDPVSGTVHVQLYTQNADMARYVAAQAGDLAGAESVRVVIPGRVGRDAAGDTPVTVYDKPGTQRWTADEFGRATETLGGAARVSLSPDGLSLVIEGADPGPVRQALTDADLPGTAYADNATIFELPAGQFAETMTGEWAARTMRQPRMAGTAEAPADFAAARPPAPRAPETVTRRAQAGPAPATTRGAPQERRPGFGFTQGVDVGGVARGAIAGGISEGLQDEDLTEEEKRNLGIATAAAGVLGGVGAARGIRNVIRGSRGIFEGMESPGVIFSSGTVRTRRGTDPSLPITTGAEGEIRRLRLDQYPAWAQEIIAREAATAGFSREARRGVLTDPVVRGLAEDEAVNVERVMRTWKPGTALNDETMQAVRNAVVGQARVNHEAVEALEAARATGRTDLAGLEENILREGMKLTRLIDIEQGGKAELGRAFRGLQRPAWETETPDEGVAKLYRKLGVKGASAAVSEYMTLIRSGAGPIELARFWGAIEAGKPTTADWLRAVRYNAMLSGVRTLLIDPASNVAELIWKGGLDIGTDVLRGDFKAAAAEMHGALVGARVGFQMAGQFFTKGISERMIREAGGAAGAALGEETVTDLINRTGGLATGAGKMAWSLEWPTRLKGAMDEFFRSTVYSMEVGRQAAAKASAEKRKGGDWHKRVAELMSNPDEPIMLRAAQIADRSTFKGEMGGFGRELSRFQRHPVGYTIMPFLRTVYHITTRGIERSPLGIIPLAAEALSKEGRAYLRGAPKRGTSPLDERVRDLVAGSLLWGAFSGLAAQGLISGAGPGSTQDREALRATGWQPYSFRHGDKWVSYTNLGPVAIPLAMAAAAAESVRYARTDADPGEIAGDGARRFAQLFSEQTYLQAIGTVWKAAMEPERFGESFVTNFATSFLPQGGLINTAAQATDPLARRGDRFNIPQAFQARIPGLRESLPAVRDVYGREVENTFAGLNAIIPFRTSELRDDPVAQEVARLVTTGHDVGLPSVENRMFGAKQTEPQQRLAKEVLGQAAYTYLAQTLANPAYEGRSDESKAATLSRVLGTAREQGALELGDRVARGEQEKFLLEWARTPQYIGVKGTPDEIARQNFEITKAHAKRNEYEKANPGLGEVMLMRNDQDAWRLTVQYPRWDRDILAIKRRQLEQALGITPEEADAAAPLVGAGSTVSRLPFSTAARSRQERLEVPALAGFQAPESGTRSTLGGFRTLS